MKTKFILLFAFMLLFQLSYSQKPSVSLTLEQLRIAVNNKDFSAISNYLAEDFNYQGIGRPMSVNILTQVINQFPSIDSLVVISSKNAENKIFLDTKVFSKNGVSNTKIIMDSNFNLVQADIANIALQGHGATKSVSSENKNNNPFNENEYIKMPFWLTETGHIVVEATINGKKGNYIVDSGTSGNLMLNSQYSSYDASNLSKKPYGVSGQVDGVGEVIIENFNWNTMTFNDIKAIVSDLNHLAKRTKINEFAGTIGYGLLKNFIIEFDYEHSQLILWKNSSFLKEMYNIKPNQIVALSMAYHIPVLQAKIGVKEIKLGIDCGAEGNMLETKWEKELRNNYSNVRKDKLGGAENNYVDVIKVAMKDIIIKEKPYEMDFVFGNLFGGAHKVDLLDGLLGYRFLSYQKTAINFRDNELYFLN
jgi:predicted aspartyl protease